MKKDITEKNQTNASKEKHGMQNEDKFNTHINTKKRKRIFLFIFELFAIK